MTHVMCVQGDGIRNFLRYLRRIEAHTVKTISQTAKHHFRELNQIRV